jgi:hypothetical protein
MDVCGGRIDPVSMWHDALPGQDRAPNVRVGVRLRRVRFARGCLDKLDMTGKMDTPRASRMGHFDPNVPLNGSSCLNGPMRDVWVDSNFPVILSLSKDPRAKRTRQRRAQMETCDG